MRVLRLTAVFFSVLLVTFATSCDQGSQSGRLLVHFIEGGAYEVYKMASEAPLQFVSEQSGSFNQPLKLSPGSYLVLADCSSKIVNIYPNRTAELTAHRVVFMPLQPPNPNDHFSIQCTRSERTRSRQHLNERFSLAILSGVRDLLVGMIPLQVNIDTKPGEPSKLLTYPLSSIAVSKENSIKTMDRFEYFITPATEVAPYTESQQDGGRLYVLKGQYKIQLNGTSTIVDLAEGESRIVIPANLKVEVSPNAELELASKIKGTPSFVEINDEHFLHLNTSYAVLPGILKIRLSTTLKSIDVIAKESETIKIHAKNVLVSLGCDLEDWVCLGSRKIRLFERGKSFPFAESVTDVPILYFGENISVGIEGSRNIKFELSGADDQRLKVGYIEISPTPTHKAGALTDLVRIESSQSQISGVSLDLSLDKPSILPLLTGQYQLAQFTFLSGDGSRRKTTNAITVGHGQKIKIPISTYLSEKRMAALEPSRLPPDEKKKQAP